MNRQRSIWIYWGIAMLTAGIYLLFSRIFGEIGYPLDDAWIHQTFARNLVQHGEWAVNPGEITAGSTSPLWTLLIAIGYGLRVPHFLWTFGLGIILLGTNLWLITTWVIAGIPEEKAAKWKLFLIVLIAGTEWHLIWSAVSGMEILLYTTLVLGCLFELTRPNHRWWLVGLIAGGIIWVRPDGITLMGPVFTALIIYSLNGNRRIGSWVAALGPFLIFLGGYLFFNYQLSGSIWPNTLAAKQVEYSILQETPYLSRLMKGLAIPFTGVGIFILPGIFLWCKRVIQEKRWDESILPAWIIGFVMLYAWKLPVTYQHGRYLIPVIPVIFAIGLKGLIELDMPDYSTRWRYIFSRAYLAAMTFTAIGFLILGMRAYQTDVDVIQSEMVASAKWIRSHTASESLIAAHDIGALGYFGERRILDLAGLINPEVIPLMNDPNQLSRYILQNNAEYLVVFPNWYNPPLEVSGNPVYPNSVDANDELNIEHMTIYKLEK